MLRPLPSTYIHTYIHASIGTIRCAAVGHRGTGGGGGEEQGGIEENIRRETFCTSAGRDVRWAGGFMDVHIDITLLRLRF